MEQPGGDGGATENENDAARAVGERAHLELREVRDRSRD